MRFTKLKLAGFKSFVEPCELRIEAGLTGVVGPNGCGKSNLLEALRWVMGATSAKAMRSGGMDDVIFAGTARRPPRDFAEVVLFGEDADGEELIVSRRIERGGGSSYRLNGADVRARDVSLAFADAATGAHSPALVSQGRIAQVIAAKPAERRAMLEEAAGVTGLHVRRREAETRLRQTEANLARLEDLQRDFETQLGSLRRQARQAERYRSLTGEIAAAEARLLYARWRDAEAAADAMRDKALAAEAAVFEATARQDKLRSRVQAVEDRVSRLRDAEREGRQRLLDEERALAARSETLRSLTERRARAADEAAGLERQRDELAGTVEDSASELARLDEDVAAGERALAQQDAALPALEDKVDRLATQGRRTEEALAAAIAKEARAEAFWSGIEQEVARARMRAEQANGAASDVRQALAALPDQQALQQALLKAEADCRRAAGAAETAKTSLAGLAPELPALRARVETAERELAETKAELAGVEREASLLAKAADRADAGAGGKGLTHAMAEVRAAPGYERAVAAALGADQDALLGKAAGPDGRFFVGAPVPPSCGNSILDRLEQCPEELRALFSQAELVDEDDGAPLSPGRSRITRAGALRRWDGYVAKGHADAGAGRLEAANRLKELEDRIPHARTCAERAEQARDAARAALLTLQRRMAAAEAEVERTRKTGDEAERRRARAEEEATSSARRRNELVQRLADAEAECELAAEGFATLEEQTRQAAPVAGQREETARARVESDDARRQYQDAAARLSAAQQERAVLRERLAARVGERAGVRTRRAEAAGRLREVEARLDGAGPDAAWPAQIAELEGQIALSKANLAALGPTLQEAANAIDRAEGERRAAVEEQSALSDELAASREARGELAARAGAEEARRDELVRIARERFERDPAGLPKHAGASAAEVGEVRVESAELDRLVTARERLGPVNLVAADELAGLEQREKEGRQEQEELAEACRRLRGSIGALNREGRDRLRRSFDQVDGHFRVLFARLFKGGQAHLALVDSDDPLEAGLEIYAQPPGKRLQSLTLLSGGEQALTAIALTFALFLSKPTPVCVLDEVDAPLDDANIDRFCDLLDHMAATTATRYLVVTHNAVTMSRMHRLFGVTMVEPGISRLVGVDLVKAEELLAAE
jgi:chromosome segregation protein